MPWPGCATTEPVSSDGTRPTTVASCREVIGVPTGPTNERLRPARTRPLECLGRPWAVRRSRGPERPRQIQRQKRSSGRVHGLCPRRRPHAAGNVGDDVSQDKALLPSGPAPSFAHAADVFESRTAEPVHVILARDVGDSCPRVQQLLPGRPGNPCIVQYRSPFTLSRWSGPSPSALLLAAGGGDAARRARALPKLTSPPTRRRSVGYF